MDGASHMWVGLIDPTQFKFFFLGYTYIKNWDFLEVDPIRKKEKEKGKGSILL
jgi:hypothetical protein